MTDPKAALEDLLKEHGFTLETRLFRQTLTEFLTPTAEEGVFSVSANPTPSEAVTNIYSGGHTWLAEQIGPGLAFVETSDNEWGGDDRMSIEVRLQDVIDQGGLIYPVQSVVTERTWYLSLPAGSVAVRAVEPS